MRHPACTRPCRFAASLFACGRGLAVAAAVVLGGPAARAQGWPAVDWPAGARVEVAASAMVLNGMSCQMRRFQVPGRSLSEVRDFYRTAFGSRRIVENRLQGDPVIATRRGDYFITVRLHASTGAEAQVEGTVLTTFTAGKPSSSAVFADTRQVFPPDTDIVSSVQTDDAGRRSLVVVGVNRNSAAANRDHVVEALAQRGFRPTGSSTGRGPAGAFSVDLASASEDASVTVSEAGPVRSVVIHRVEAAK